MADGTSVKLKLAARTPAASNVKPTSSVGKLNRKRLKRMYSSIGFRKLESGDSLSVDDCLAYVSKVKFYVTRGAARLCEKSAFHADFCRVTPRDAPNVRLFRRGAFTSA